ncbi:uncharacterized protein LOC135111571 isoform X2 [Scylla paramamosain]|uniref:uncharacterized protein LOC135111571 isoform X2 n=1 Tax=Scylla paramamosain TaxID=85552 RepID=UPI003082EF87
MDTDSELLVGKTEEENLELDAPKARGKVKNKEEAIELLRRTSFTHLPKEGREAFFRYLCNDKYPEDKDICDIDPKANGMDESSQKYQFWLQCEQVEHFSKFFQVYVMSEKRFPEVKKCFDESGDENLKNFLDEKKKNIDNIKSFATHLRDKIQPELDEMFKEFKNSLREEFGD